MRNRAGVLLLVWIPIACSDSAPPEQPAAAAGVSGSAGQAGQLGMSGSSLAGAGAAGATVQAGAASGGVAAAGGGAGGASGAGTGGALPSTGGQANDLKNIAAGLDGFRWEIACGDPVGDWSCVDLAAGVDSCPASGTRFADKTVTLGGVPGELYALELRFRGIMEPNVYTGGTRESDGFHVGGGGGGHRNIVAIHVSEPAQVYYLNSVSSTEGPHYALEVDYVKKLQVSAGATVQMTGADQDCITDKNCKLGVSPCEPIAVPDVPPFPATWDGNFIQMDVVSVAPVP